MRAPDSQLFQNIAAATAAFPLIGGRYAVAVSATFGGGSVAIQKLGPDGSAYLDIKNHFNNAGSGVELVIGNFATAGVYVLDLPPGLYRFNVTTATAVYVEAVRVPGE